MTPATPQLMEFCPLMGKKEEMPDLLQVNSLSTLCRGGERREHTCTPNTPSVCLSDFEYDIRMLPLSSIGSMKNNL